MLKSRNWQDGLFYLKPFSPARTVQMLNNIRRSGFSNAGQALEFQFIGRIEVNFLPGQKAVRPVLLFLGRLGRRHRFALLPTLQHRYPVIPVGAVLAPQPAAGKEHKPSRQCCHDSLIRGHFRHGSPPFDTCTGRAGLL